jgi:hypothetical protein
MITINLQPILEQQYGKPVVITDIRVRAANFEEISLEVQIVPEGEASSVTWIEIKR